jgi:threonylcarbamoyladenosine tRNA methylthiotransferase MtaB
MPEVAIGTDLIAGFPGESATDFKNYFNFVEALPLAYFHVFPFSVRSGTTAAKMSNQVPASEIKSRAAALRELGEAKRAAFARRFIGRRLKVLLEENDARGLLRGYSRNYIRVLTKGDLRACNQEVEVEVESSIAEGAELVGQIVAEADRAGDSPAFGLGSV